MHAKAAGSLCAACLTKSKEKSHTLPERFWDAYIQEKRREEFSVRKTKVYAEMLTASQEGKERL